MSQGSFAAGGYTMHFTVDDGNRRVTSITSTCEPHGNPSTCEECYQAEVRAFARADVYVAYLDENARTVVTFPGRQLARTVSIKRDQRRYTPTGGTFRMVRVCAVAPDGSVWLGAGNDDAGTIITLRRRGASRAPKDPYRDADRFTDCPQCGTGFGWNLEDGLSGQQCQCGYQFTGHERKSSSKASVKQNALLQDTRQACTGDYESGNGVSWSQS